MSKNLKVGDLCITINTNHPACNDGVLVVIVSVDHTIRDAWGNAAPYSIKRIDGQRHVSTHSRDTGEPQWLSCMTAWCAGYKLKRVDDGEQVQESTRVLEEVAARTCGRWRSYCWLSSADRHNGGHMLGKDYVSTVLDRQLPRPCQANLNLN